MPFSREQIWPVVANVTGYPKWYPRSVKVRTVPVAAVEPEVELEIQPWGVRRFRCRVEFVEPVQRMTMRYGGGFIEGTGEWRLEAVSGGTRVVYDFKVELIGRWVALIDRVLPLARMHSRLMRDILHSLEREVFRRSNPR